MARALIPNSTQVPDVILDRWMAELSGAEFKVLLYVARRTYGFGKDSDRISLNQMARGIRRRDGTRLDHGMGLSRSGVKSACNALIARGLLLRASNIVPGGLEPEESTYRLNLHATLPGEEGREVGQESAGVGREEAHPGVGRPPARVGQERSGGGPGSGRGVGRGVAPQETGPQETGQETAHAAKGMVQGGGAGAGSDLVAELVGHGVTRTVAERLAAGDPAACRRCLEYLPHVRVRTTPGAWLATAIRAGFGPPGGYVRANRGGAGEAGTPPGRGRRAGGRMARRRSLEDGLAFLGRGHDEASAAFAGFLAVERGRAERAATSLSAKGRDLYLAGFDSDEHRLELFGRWLRGEGRSFRSLLIPRGVPGVPETSG